MDAKIYILILFILYIVLVIFVNRKIKQIDCQVEHTEAYLFRRNNFQADEITELYKKIKELDEKVNSKTNADIFHDTFGYDVPKDMYNRYIGYWESKFVKRK